VQATNARRWPPRTPAPHDLGLPQSNLARFTLAHPAPASWSVRRSSPTKPLGESSPTPPDPTTATAARFPFPPPPLGRPVPRIKGLGQSHTPLPCMTSAPTRRSSPP